MRHPGATTLQTVGVDETLRTAARRMSAAGLSCLVAVEAGTPRAVVTERDVALGSLCGGIDPSASVASLRWRPLVTVVQGERADAVLRRMEEHGLRHLPVANEAGEIVGMVAVEDALALVLQDLIELTQRARVGPAPLLRGTPLRAEDTQMVLPSIDGGAPVRAVAALLRRTGAEALLVLEGTRPAGIATERDLLSIVASRRGAGLARARDLVSHTVATVDPRDPLEAVVELMDARGVDQVAVVRGDETLGMVSLQGVLAGLALELLELLAWHVGPRSAEAPPGRVLH